MRNIHVKCVPFSEILETHGIPYYLKIDIEGNDHFCLEELTKESIPKYLSIEMSERSEADIRILAELGYDQFKCIRQNDLRPITPGNINRNIAFRRVVSRPDIIGKVLRTLRVVITEAFPPREGDWRTDERAGLSHAGILTLACH